MLQQGISLHCLGALWCWCDWFSVPLFSEFPVATANPYVWRNQQMVGETASRPESSRTLETSRCVSFEDRGDRQSLWHLWINSENVACLASSEKRNHEEDLRPLLIVSPQMLWNEVYEEEICLRSEQAIFASFELPLFFLFLILVIIGLLDKGFSCAVANSRNV